MLRPVGRAPSSLRSFLVAAAAVALSAAPRAGIAGEAPDAGVPDASADAGTPPADGGAAPTAPPDAAPPAAPPPTTLPPSNPGGAAPKPPTSWLSGTLKLQARGVFVVNVAHNSGTLVPGGFAFYALPPGVSLSQFFISPANTVLGFGLSGLRAGRVDMSGGLDVTLRSPTPLQTANIISPQFYSVYIQLETPRLRIILGQYPDVLLPFIPDIVNSFPSGYLPGAIGYARPQIRVDTRLPFGELVQLIARLSASQPIQTFDLSADAIGRQGGRPDVQGRLALAGGRGKPWDRSFEIGAAAHTGVRRVTFVDTRATRQFRTWSVAGDLRLHFRTGTLIKGRLWRGALLGDYGGGIVQTVDLDTGRPIDAWGFWGEAQQAIGDRLRAAICYGRDDPFDSDLGMGARTLNQAALGNLFWDASSTIGFAAELSRWATSYLGGGTTVVWRVDVLSYLRF